MWLARRRRPLWASLPSSLKPFLKRSCRSSSTLVIGSERPLPTSSLPRKAEVVICGGGVQGTAIAYELAKRGIADEVVVIDKGPFGGGTTSNSPGLASLLKKSYIETKLSKFSKALFLELEQEHHFHTGWRQCGSLWKSQSGGSEVECEIVLPHRISELAPLLRIDDLEGGLFIPGDGVADPVEICFALAHVASQKGVQLVPNCEIKAVKSKGGLVEGLDTSQGYISCKHFVNAAGMYARRVGKLSEPTVNIPLHAAEHYFLHTKPIDNLVVDEFCFPVVRDPDGHVYCRQKGTTFVAGGFEPVAKPADDRIGGKEARQADWDHFHVLLENLLHRLPFLVNAKLDHLTNGLEPFSPDGQLILGRAPEIRNYFVAAAMRSVSVTALSGVAHVICDLILKGRSPFDVHNQDARRFLPMHNNRSFLKDRVKEVPGKVYAVSFPFEQYRTGRALRTSPIFTALSDAGARFNQVMGYERPMYFEPSSTSSSPLSSSHSTLSFSENFMRSDRNDETSTKDTFYKPEWYSCAKREYIASRERVSLCDFSSFAKFDIGSGGLEVVDMLQKLCSNDIDVPVGTVVHTGMQNELGGYENDVTVARLADNRFFLMAPSIQQTRAYAWMKQHLPQDESIYLQDETSSFTTLCLMGPYAKSTLSKLTSSSLDAFPFFTAKYLDVSFAPDILTLNVTHTGELGYVLYIPNEFALHVFNAIVEAGYEFGIEHCGYFAMRALRIEKFYAFWGHDLDSKSTPIECGRAFRVKLDSGIDFIGRSALEHQLHSGIRKMLIMAILDNNEHDYESDPWPWGGEPLFRNGKFVGHTTTTSFGFSLESHVALGYVYNERDEETIDVDYVKQGEYEIEIAGRRFPVRIRLNPPVLPLRVGARGDLAANYQPTRHAS